MEAAARLRGRAVSGKIAKGGGASRAVAEETTARERRDGVSWLPFVGVWQRASPDGRRVEEARGGEEELLAIRGRCIQRDTVHSPLWPSIDFPHRRFVSTVHRLQTSIAPRCCSRTGDGTRSPKSPPEGRGESSRRPASLPTPIGLSLSEPVRPRQLCQPACDERAARPHLVEGLEPMPLVLRRSDLCRATPPRLSRPTRAGGRLRWATAAVDAHMAADVAPEPATLFHHTCGAHAHRQRRKAAAGLGGAQPQRTRHVGGGSQT